VCFNSVALLFLCEIDNLAYATLLPEHVRTRVESEGRVDIDEREAVTLMRSKVVHAVALVVAVPVGLQDPANIISLLPKVIFWFGGLIEAVLNANNAAEACKGVVTATVKFWSGIFVVDLFVD
jgi:hypothetical protein